MAGSLFDVTRSSISKCTASIAPTTPMPSSLRKRCRNRSLNSTTSVGYVHFIVFHCIYSLFRHGFGHLPFFLFPLVMLTWAREQEMKNASASKLDLTDYLIKPVQRICKYPLLFRVRPITPVPFSAALTVTLTTGPDANTLCSVPAGADQEHRHGGEPEGVRQVARD